MQKIASKRWLPAAATLLLVAFVFALAAVVAPQLHERIHGAASVGTHDCAIAQIGAGNCLHFMAAPHATRSNPEPSGRAFLLPATPTIIVSLRMARLEHAPPAAA